MRIAFDLVWKIIDDDIGHGRHRAPTYWKTCWMTGTVGLRPQVEQP